jgi:hypothetical protein
VFYAVVTANPTGVSTTQAARNLFLRYTDRFAGSRALVRDRGSQFVDAFDEIFRTDGQQPPIPHTVSPDTDPRRLRAGRIIPVQRTHQ